jgi:outer membrane usher protein
MAILARLARLVTDLRPSPDVSLCLSAVMLPNKKDARAWCVLPAAITMLGVLMTINKPVCAQILPLVLTKKLDHGDEKIAETDQAIRHELYLEVMLNGEPTSVIARFQALEERLFARSTDLHEIGILVDHSIWPSTAEVPLDAIAGLSYRYDAGRQTINLHVPQQIRKPYTVTTRATSAIPEATASRGGVLNYDVYAQTGAAAQASAWNEARYFDPLGIFSTTGVASWYRKRSRYLRYDTSWSTSNPNALSAKRIGDTISSALAWTRSIRLAGFQWRSNFALRPDLVTFPMPAFKGSALVPSSVDLYVNNVRQFSGNVPSGPFIIHDIPGITGWSEATIITRDALGRPIATSVPLYIDTRLLAKGLASYSFEAGFLRENYGLESFHYDSRPAASASARYGVTERLTVEAHVEATSGLYNAGGGALFQLGMAGVVNAAVSGSAGRLAGTQVSLGYQFTTPYFSFNAQSMRTYARYGDLAAHDGAPVASATDNMTVSLALSERQTVSLSYIVLRYASQSAAKIGSVSYTRTLGRSASLNISAYQDFRHRKSRGALLSVSFSLGNNTSVNASIGRQHGQTSYDVNLSRPADYSGGWGWRAQAGGTNGGPYQQAQLQYLGRMGEATALAQNIAGRTAASFEALGAWVWMDGGIHAARRIDDGFTLVSTDGVAGVPVLHENRMVGTTDGKGHFLVPDLNAYQRNQIAIDSMGLPAGVKIDATARVIVPQAQSGVLSRFGIARFHAASIILHGSDGASLRPGLAVRHIESGQRTLVGYDGLTFIDQLQATNHLVVTGRSVSCSVKFAYQPPADGSLETIGPLVCRPLAAGNLP